MYLRNNMTLGRYAELYEDFMNHPSSNIREFSIRNGLSTSSGYRLVAQNHWLIQKRAILGSIVEMDFWEEMKDLDTMILKLLKRILLATLDEIASKTKSNKLTLIQMRQLRAQCRRLITWIQKKVNDIKAYDIDFEDMPDDETNKIVETLKVKYE